jgi:hypothetical protein
MRISQTQGHVVEKEKHMSAPKKKATRIHKDELTPAERQEVDQIGAYSGDEILAKLHPAERREIERRTYGPTVREPRLQADRLYTLAGALAPLMEELHEQAADLHRKLQKIEEDGGASYGRGYRRGRSRRRVA